jgi:HK97 family phage major capsid protein
VNTLGTAAGGTVPADHIYRAAAGCRGSSFLDPDTLIINPTNWGTIRTTKDTSGQYYGGGPFYGPYGGPQGPAPSFSGGAIWNLNVLVTSAIGDGTAVVGAFRQGGAVYRRGGLTVEASNSHSDFFQKNLTALRAEERLVLAIYRPSAFCVLSF